MTEEILKVIAWHGILWGSLTAFIVVSVWLARKG